MKKEKSNKNGGKPAIRANHCFNSDNDIPYFRGCTGVKALYFPGYPYFIAVGDKGLLRLRRGFNGKCPLLSGLPGRIRREAPSQWGSAS
jgi:hypothetical protein